MSVASRPVSTGKTRTCPHCKATILESLSICPGCMHHLRFDSEAAKRQVAAAPALRVKGIIRHPPLEPPLEYFVIIAIRNDRGEEVTRQVVNVGALQAAEKRTFTLSVEVLPPQAPVPPQKSNASTGTFKAPTAPQPSPATVRPSTPAPPGAAASPAATPAATSTPQAQPRPPTPPKSPAVTKPSTAGGPPVAPRQAPNPGAPGTPNTSKAPTPNTGGYANPNNPASRRAGTCSSRRAPAAPSVTERPDAKRH